MNKKILAASLVGLFICSGLVQAADIDAGKTKAAVCAGCHGADGIAVNPVWPNLAGQNVDYFVAQIKAFKVGNRKNELMSPMAQTLSDEDAANIAAYFYSLGKK